MDTSKDVHSVPESFYDEYLRLGKVQSLSPVGNIACAIFLTSIGILSTIGNGLVVLVISRSKKLRVKPHNVLLLNMAASDFLISIFGFPFTTISCFAGKFIFSELVCVTQGVITFTLCLSAMNTLSLVSVYRYVAVCHPNLKPFLNLRRTRTALVVLWIYTVLMTTPPLYVAGSYTLEPYGTACTIDWTNRSIPNILYVCVLVIFAYVSNFVIMATCYFHIVRKAKGLRLSTSITMDIDAAIKVNKMRGELKVCVMCLVMVITYAIIWSPYTFVSLCSVFGVDVPLWLTVLPSMFAKLASATNPIIYAASNDGFRDALEAFMCSKWNKVQPQNNVTVGRTKRKQKEGDVYTIDRTKEGVYIGMNNVKMAPRSDVF